MRLALISDIHGKAIALDAVLADIQACGDVDGYLVLGDLAAIGYDPAGVIERLIGLPNMLFTMGNTDRYLVSGNFPPPSIEDVKVNSALLLQYTQVNRNFAWTQGYLTARGWLDWLAQLPLETRTTLPNGMTLLGVHASPGHDDDPGIHPQLSDEEIEIMLNSCGADLVCVGHTHIPLDRTVGVTRVVNLGSISNPVTGDRRASYVILEADSDSYCIQHRYVDYNHEAVIAAAHKAKYPGLAYLTKFMRGEVRSRWL
ncbi:MAG: metallophosphoesterase family protein [Chloroflexota bacterium]